MPTGNFVRCPQCGRKYDRVEGNQAVYRCGHCEIYFDNEPDEGGNYSHRNPAARLEREERARERKLKRIGRRP